jgi:hypothetical protein
LNAVLEFDMEDPLIASPMPNRGKQMDVAAHSSNFAQKTAYARSRRGVKFGTPGLIALYLAAR